VFEITAGHLPLGSGSSPSRSAPERDPSDPGLERPIATKGLAAVKRLNERVMRDVPRIRTATRYSRNHIAKGDIAAPVPVLYRSLACSHY